MAEPIVGTALNDGSIFLARGNIEGADGYISFVEDSNPSDDASVGTMLDADSRMMGRGEGEDANGYYVFNTGLAVAAAGAGSEGRRRSWIDAMAELGANAVNKGAADIVAQADALNAQYTETGGAGAGGTTVPGTVGGTAPGDYFKLQATTGLFTITAGSMNKSLGDAVDGTKKTSGG
ncbi:MAG: hypothetical protein H7Y33_17035 [Cytophagales bacterium]|nr:hypothetical protein [Rhizobacter sp.]